MDRAHDVNISFWPASGSSAGGLDRQRAREGASGHGELTVRVCIGRVSLCNKRSVAVVVTGLVARGARAHTQKLADGPPAHYGCHAGLKAESSWAGASGQGGQRAEQRWQIGGRGAGRV
jgi:hypothetical protein